MVKKDPKIYASWSMKWYLLKDSNTLYDCVNHNKCRTDKKKTQVNKQTCKHKQELAIIKTLHESVVLYQPNIVRYFSDKVPATIGIPGLSFGCFSWEH